MEMNSYKKIETDRIKILSILWGTQKKITSNNFKGGKATSIFGYSEIDLTECKLDNKSVVIDILGIFGGSTLIVPKEWNVVVDVFSLFGGFSNKIRRTPETKVDMEKTLTIKGLVLFGYGELKSII
jgi:predicted membrane protein